MSILMILSIISFQFSSATTFLTSFLNAVDLLPYINSSKFFTRRFSNYNHVETTLIAMSLQGLNGMNIGGELNRFISWGSEFFIVGKYLCRTYFTLWKKEFLEDLFTTVRIEKLKGIYLIHNEGLSIWVTFSKWL